MLKLKFFKKQQIWLPTIPGLILIGVSCLALTIFVINNLANYLALQQPVNKGILVVEGWVSEQTLLQAIHAYKTNPYQQIITTGGLIKRRQQREYKSYADSAAAFLLKNGINKSEVTSLPTPDSAQNRTFLSAVIVRDWLIKQKNKTQYINVVSEGVHARRTLILYQMAFANKLNIGIMAGEPEEYSLDSWWGASAGVKTVISELIGLAWSMCCFYPGEYQSHQEKWGLS